MKNKTNKKYHCKHCNQKFDTLYMADICFQLDLKLLQNDKPDKQISGSKKQPGNK
jgi:hypothetical protein